MKGLNSDERERLSLLLLEQMELQGRFKYHIANASVSVGGLVEDKINLSTGDILSKEKKDLVINASQLENLCNLQQLDKLLTLKIEMVIAEIRRACNAPLHANLNLHLEWEGS